MRMAGNKCQRVQTAFTAEARYKGSESDTWPFLKRDWKQKLQKQEPGTTELQI